MPLKLIDIRDKDVKPKNFERDVLNYKMNKINMAYEVKDERRDSLSKERDMKRRKEFDLFGQIVA